MLDNEMIQASLTECRKKREYIKSIKNHIPDWEKVLQDEEEKLLSLIKTQDTVRGVEEKLRHDLRNFHESLLTQDLKIDNFNITGTRKPDVQIIEEILESNGPMHIYDIVQLGRERGVNFNGKKKPTQIARDKLNGSKRFMLFGNNIWGLPNQESLVQL